MHKTTTSQLNWPTLNTCIPELNRRKTGETRKRLEPGPNQLATASKVASAVNGGRSVLVSGLQAGRHFNPRGGKVVKTTGASAPERAEIFCCVRDGTPAQ